jgi:A/G-specific adenine glycosylase
MELGALVCTPRSPNCAACPVQKLCIAQKEKSQDQLPNLSKRAIATERRFLAFIVGRVGKFLVRQRPAGVVNAHLWEFPNVEVTAIDRARYSAPAVVWQIEDGPRRTGAPFRQTDFQVSSPNPLCTIKHSITRYRITLEAWRAELAGSSAKIPGRWLTAKQLHQLAFTSAHKKILARLGAPGPASARRNGSH